MRGGRHAALPVVVALAVVATSAGCTDHHNHATPPPTPTPSATCKLIVTETGFTAHRAYLSGQRIPEDDSMRVGVLVKNPCPDVAMGVSVTASGADKSGAILPNPLYPGDKIRATAEVPVIAPGATVAVSAGMGITDARGNTPAAFRNVTKFDATARASCWAKPHDKREHTPTASKVSVGPTDADGHSADRYANITFTVTPSEPSGPTLAVAVFRDSTGRLLDAEEGTGTYSTASPPAGQSVISVWVPRNAAVSRTQVMVRPAPKTPQC